MDSIMKKIKSAAVNEFIINQAKNDVESYLWGIISLEEFNKRLVERKRFMDDINHRDEI